MTRWLLGTAVLAISMVIGAAGAADTKPSISDVMKKVNSKMGLNKAVAKALRENTVDWEDIQKKTKEITEQIDHLGKNTPPKGSKESWEKLTKAYVENVKKLDDAATKKDKDAATTVQTTIGRSCGACHNVHQDN